MRRYAEWEIAKPRAMVALGSFVLTFGAVSMYDEIRISSASCSPRWCIIAARLQCGRLEPGASRGLVMPSASDFSPRKSHQNSPGAAAPSPPWGCLRRYAECGIAKPRALAALGSFVLTFGAFSMDDEIRVSLTSCSLRWCIIAARLRCSWDGWYASFLPAKGSQ